MKTDTTSTLRFQVGDWVKVNHYVQPFLITAKCDEPHRYLVQGGERPVAETELTWTLGPSINGHALQPGQKWHRESGWTQEMLPSPYRPLIAGEARQTGDEHPDTDGEWFAVATAPSHENSATNTWTHCRTTRPLPGVEKPEPFAAEKKESLVTDEMVDQCYSVYIKSSADNLGSMRAALTRAFEMAGVEGIVKERDELRQKLAYAEDAASKGELARQRAGGMEMEIAELRQKLNDADAHATAEAHAHDESRKDLGELRQKLEAAENEIEARLQAHLEVAKERNELKARVEKAEGQILEVQKHYQEVWTMREALSSKLEEVTRHAEAWKAIAQASEATKDSWEKDCESLRAELATLREQAKGAAWVPLSERKPTAEDADENGQVHYLTEKRYILGTSVRNSVTGCTHWRRTNLPVPIHPAVSLFERYADQEYPQDATEYRAIAKRAWDAAWKAAAGKEGK